MSAKMIGSATTGLVGPYAFPFQWTFQRRTEHQYTSRRRARHLTQSAPAEPFYIEAVTPPLNVLRDLATALVKTVHIHAMLNIGFSALQRMFPGQHDDIAIDFADTPSIAACPRDGTRGLLQKWQTWFQMRYAKLQHRALANGRYFPPPTIMRVHLARDERMHIVMAFAHGFLPEDRQCVMIPFLKTRHGRTWFLSPGEPIPQQNNLRAFLLACAENHTLPGEIVLGVGTIYPHGNPCALDIRAGDELRAVTEMDRGRRLVLDWQDHNLGVIEQAKLRDEISARSDVRMCFLRKGFLNASRCRLAFAAFAMPASQSQ